MKRTPTRKNTLKNWMQRRVCFLVSDAYHKITPVNITMPVRIKEEGESQTIYEGPIETMWETVVSPRINTSEMSKQLSIYEHDLVGVLIADTGFGRAGLINWLVQSDVGSASEAGADRIKKRAA